MMLEIKNRKRKFSTITEVRSSIFGQLKGLMFSLPLKKQSSLLLKFNKQKNIPIHMLFVFFPIDAVWINSRNNIVHIKRNIKPFTININPKTPSKAILETSKNATRNLKVGDKLIFTSNNL